MFMCEIDQFAIRLNLENTQSMSPSNMTLEILYSAMIESAEDNRLVEGIMDCIELLNRNPNEVGICLLPVHETQENVNMSIQLILLESICQEYNIPVIKVDISQIQSTISLCHTNKSTLSPSKTSMSKKYSFLADLECCFIRAADHNLGANELKLLKMLHDIEVDHYTENNHAEYPK